ncbi:hypothetical protein KP509_06G033400 [Ceratopteris richardii]|uniref:Glycosyltransferase n=1 Tax=Ceratopteris richardii TaxID=49495 RepID=A0A8T2UJP7_CERRI|nr:hypothetical protein KP509_06G033400 [Ceratopteris richardii]
MRDGKVLHAIVCAYPALGHLNPLLRLSILFAQQHIPVTFVSTQFYCDRLRELLRNGHPCTRTGSQQQGLDGADETFERGSILEGIFSAECNSEQGKWHECHEKQWDISFEGLSDGLPIEFDRRSPSTELSRAIEHLRPAFEDLLRRLLHPNPNVSYFIIYDAFLSWTRDVAMSPHIPRILFWPQSASVFTIFRRTEHILRSGINPFVDDLDADPGRMIDCIPGLPVLPASYLPYRIQFVAGKDRRFLLYENLGYQDRQCREASCILINSLDWLERLPDDTLKSNIATPIKLVGPLVLLPYLELDLSVFSNRVECEEIMEWLDTQSVSSVLYICLGSVVSWTKSQIQEISLGLTEKQQPFLWVMRPWEMRHVLPPEVLKFGKVVAFAPQIQVLGHPSVGGFLSHCGWNSTLESLTMGIPILAWPHFLDQFPNCWFVVHVWKVGVQLSRTTKGRMEDVVVDRNQFTAALALLMEGESKELMKLNSMNMKKQIQERLRQYNSYSNLRIILSELLPERASA